MDFSSLAIKLNEKTSINYGVFINTLVDFLIVAFAIFLVVKQINRLKRAPPPADSALGPHRPPVRNTGARSVLVAVSVQVGVLVFVLVVVAAVTHRLVAFFVLLRTVFAGSAPAG